MVVTATGPDAAGAKGGEEAYRGTDPVAEVRQLLDTLVNPKFSLEQRLTTLQPLAAAAGLAPRVPGSRLHSGSVLFALTDPECAQKASGRAAPASRFRSPESPLSIPPLSLLPCPAQVVAIINSDSLPAEIKRWVLSLMLSLVHPENGLHVDTQVAMMATGLPKALCRLLVRSSTPLDQRVQCLAMMRVLVQDSATHSLLVEAKVVPAIVKQVRKRERTAS